MGEPFLVTPEWLLERLESVRVLDVRGEVAAAQPRYRAHPERYRAGHIPGAVFADWRHDFTDPASAVPVTVAPPERFAADATRLGIGVGTPVVCYDDYRNILAGRVAWVLRAYRHRAVHLVDGGLAAWTAAGLPLEAGVVAPRPAHPPYPPPGPAQGLLDLEGTRRAMAAGALLVDARPADEYAGKETHARRSGHIPGALNVPYRSLLDGDGRFLPPARLAAVMTAAGVDPAVRRPVVCYCNGGVSATAVAYAIELAGGDRPAVYDGSWNEWGNRDDTAVQR
jgi:thiosulfate/3-mercaptopyruvate sulfurtransferase